MIPIFKTADKLNMSHFRQISLLISFSKLFDRIIFTRIYSNVVPYKILAIEQYGFRNKLSANNASYTLIREVFPAMNIKRTVGGIYHDLSKAFDCVNHRILLAKLEHYGIRGTFGAFVKYYLTERYETLPWKENLILLNALTGNLLNME